MHVYASKGSQALSGRLPHRLQSIYWRKSPGFVRSFLSRFDQSSSSNLPSLGRYNTISPSPQITPTLFTMPSQASSFATTLAGNGNSEQPWYAVYPAARSSPTPISCTELLGLLKKGDEGAKTVLVDLRRTDYEGGTITGSINLPAQSLYPTIPSLYSIFHAAGVRRVVWYCGSSRGRGNRAATWFADYLKDVSDQGMQSLVLDGGIKGWVGEGGGVLALCARL